MRTAKPELPTLPAPGARPKSSGRTSRPLCCLQTGGNHAGWAGLGFCPAFWLAPRVCAAASLSTQPLLHPRPAPRPSVGAAGRSRRFCRRLSTSTCPPALLGPSGRRSPLFPAPGTGRAEACPAGGGWREPPAPAGIPLPPAGVEKMALPAPPLPAAPHPCPPRSLPPPPSPCPPLRGRREAAAVYKKSPRGGREGGKGRREGSRERERGYRAGGAAGEGEGRGAGSGTMAQSVWGYDSDNGEWGCGAAGRAGSEPGWHFLAFPPPQDPSTGMKTTPWPRETSSRPLRSTPKTCSTTILSALGTPVTIPGQRKPSWTTGAPAESSSTTCSIDQVGFWFGFRGLLGIKVCKALGIKCILWYPAYGGWQRKVIWVHKKRAPSGGSGGSGHV